MIFCCIKTQQKKKLPACLPVLENFPMLGETSNQFSLASLDDPLQKFSFLMWIRSLSNVIPQHILYVWE
jgi:hypothetical protein